MEVPKTGGLIGMTECPGKNEYPVFGIPVRPWRRDLDQDLRVILAWRADILVSLIEDYEFNLYNVSELPAKAEKLGIRWLHLPIGDGCIPDSRFEKAWETVGKELRRVLTQSGRIVLHCRTGLGRSSTIAARLLVEFGMTPFAAFTAVRRARPISMATCSCVRPAFLLAFFRRSANASSSFLVTPPDSPSLFFFGFDRFSVSSLPG